MITIKSTKYSKADIDFCEAVFYNGLHLSCPFYEKESVYSTNYCDLCNHKLACTELKSAYHHMLSKKLRAEAIEQSGVFTLDVLEFPVS